jgi:histidine triad (HIT) family protein
LRAISRVQQTGQYSMGSSSSGRAAGFSGLAGFTHRDYSEAARVPATLRVAHSATHGVAGAIHLPTAALRARLSRLLVHHGTMAADCTFCRIVSGDTAAPMVLEDNLAVAFLDHRPLFPGHMLLIPRAHVETLLDLPDEQVGPLFSTAKLLARALEEALGAEGSFIAVNNRISQSVPHLHVHIVPRRKKDGLKGFFWPRSKYADDEQMESVRVALHDAVQRLRIGDRHSAISTDS